MYRRVYVGALLLAMSCAHVAPLAPTHVTPRCPYSSTGAQPMPVYRLDWYGYMDFNALRYADGARTIPLNPCTVIYSLRMPRCGPQVQNVSNGTAPDCGRPTVLV